VFLILQTAVSTAALAGKFDFSVGYFSLSATTKNSTGSVSNLGSFRLGYRHEILPQLELAAGYTVNTSKLLGGDLAYGMDLGVLFYPLTECCARQSNSGGVIYEFSEKWRPYVGVSFHQRQFQAIQTSYPGIGAALGTEYSLTPSLSARGELRLISLFGSNLSSAREFSTTLGVSFAF
jgi:long-subunit fatty acid transport protein